MATAPSAAQPLSGTRIIEFASYVAGPSGGMALAQLGADVIRVDPIGGAADYTRWPLSRRSGDSLFWSSLNRGKRSVSLDTRSLEGRELLVALATAEGPGGGILLDNAPGASWLAYDALRARRDDVIKVHIQGYSDGRGAVDYTVNPEVGIPHLTGPGDHSAPVNHTLPAWDLLTGMTAATGLLATLRRRDHTGEGGELSIALADVALAGLASLGWLTETDERGSDRERVGNYLYGSYGADFATRDGGRVMVVALTVRQWEALCAATSTAPVFAALADALGADWGDEGARFTHRELISAVLRPWFQERTLDDISEQLTRSRVLWSKYGTMTESIAAFRSDPRRTVLQDVVQPGIGSVVAATSPLRTAHGYGDARPAPLLAQHTEEVLTEVLGLSRREIGALAQGRVIGIAA